MTANLPEELQIMVPPRGALALATVAVRGTFLEAVMVAYLFLG